MSPRKKHAAPSVTMERGKDHVVIIPRNTLKARAVVMHEGPPVLDETAVRRAEQALKALSVQFNGWMEDAVGKLAALRDETLSSGFGEGRLGAFHRAAHDIRGQATTLGFPLASRVGSSLCQILEGLPPARLAASPFAMLIDQHVDAIRAITREGVTRAVHPVGETLTQELEMMSERLLANANGAVLQ
jgi:HPt (histidine-containing phosphotransfer) domain-containing protein